MIVLIDNYDSFTYNIVQYLRELKADVLILRNDEETVDQIISRKPSGILLSPGPGRPEESGVSFDLLKHQVITRSHVPLLGVCLGHQIIAEYFGADVINAPRVMHGKTSHMQHDDKGVFKGLRNPLEIGRYHSLIVDGSTMPECLDVSGFVNYEGSQEIMGLRHKMLPIEGVQFHPESVLTQDGHGLFQNFLAQVASAEAKYDPVLCTA